jgi:hypothetical protein
MQGIMTADSGMRGAVYTANPKRLSAGWGEAISHMIAQEIVRLYSGTV